MELCLRRQYERLQLWENGFRYKGLFDGLHRFVRDDEVLEMVSPREGIYTLVCYSRGFRPRHLSELWDELFE